MKLEAASNYMLWSCRVSMILTQEVLKQLIELSPSIFINTKELTSTSFALECPTHECPTHEDKVQAST